MFMIRAIRCFMFEILMFKIMHDGINARHRTLFVNGKDIRELCKLALEKIYLLCCCIKLNNMFMFL